MRDVPSPVPGESARNCVAAMRFGVWYDFRNPRAWHVDWPSLYGSLLDQAVYAEQLGFESIWLSEHHFTDDGYLPSVSTMLGALAGRTSTARLGSAVMPAPLHHPLRLAEDTALADQMSTGRLELGLAPGHRPSEFRVLGVDRRQRGNRTDETIEILRLAWSGDRFSFHGRYFSFDDVIVQPPPHQDSGVPLWVGGSSVAAADRAARYGTNFMPDSGATEEIYDRFRSQFAKWSVPEIATNRVLFAAERTELAWEQCGDYLLYQFNGYRRWSAEASDADSHGGELRDPSQLSREHYFVGTPDAIVAAIEESRKRLGYDCLIFWARPPGMPIEMSTRSLELISKHVLPAFDR